MNNHKKTCEEREREKCLLEKRVTGAGGERERESRLLEKRVTGTDREREKRVTGTEREREREKRLLEKRVTGTERERETSFREASDGEGERERASLTHAAFPLGTIPYPDTPQAISQHPCDVTRSRDCSRSVPSLFGSVRFYIFFFFLAEIQ